MSEPDAWQHRARMPGYSNWHEWRDGRANFSEQWEYEERPLFTGARMLEVVNERNALLKAAAQAESKMLRCIDTLKECADLLGSMARSARVDGRDIDDITMQTMAYDIAKLLDDVAAA